MEDKKFCSNCGTENNSESTICKSCGRVLYQNKKEEENVITTDETVDNKVVNSEINDDKKAGNTIGIICLVLIFGLGVLFPIFISRLNLGSFESNPIFVYIPLISIVAGIILMIYGVIKYASNKFLKTIITIICACIVIGIVFFIILIHMCAKSISDTCSNNDPNEIRDTCEALE